MQIDIWPVNKLIPYSRNPRKNDHAVDRMAAAIQEFGFKIPILVRSNGEVVDSHLRLKAAQKIGIEMVPVILCDEWTESQVKAFRLLVNRSVTWADWDLQLVAMEIGELRTLDFDLKFTGFEPIELDRFLFGAEVEPQGIPEPPQKPVARLGDVWLCGRHRVLCGDATSSEAVGLAVGTAKPTLMVTDPPYGVSYDPTWRERVGLGRQRQRGAVLNDNQADWSQAYQLFHGDVAYVWHAGVHAALVVAGLETAGLRIRAQIVWAKQHFVRGRGDYQNACTHSPSGVRS